MKGVLFGTILKKLLHQIGIVLQANVSFVEIESDRGHDSFLLDEPEMFATILGFLNSAAMSRGVL